MEVHLPCYPRFAQIPQPPFSATVGYIQSVGIYQCALSVGSLANSSLGIVPLGYHCRQPCTSLSQVCKVIQKSKKTCEAEEKSFHYVFNSKDFKEESKAELRRIGGLLMWQPDLNKVKTLFPLSRYLIDIDKKDNASTGKNQPTI